MDPDQALADLRAAMGELSAVRDGVFPQPDLAQAIEVATEAFEALDSWLKRGGFSPADWRQ